MIYIKNAACLILFLHFFTTVNCQPPAANNDTFSLVVLNERLQPVDGATVKLLKDDGPVNVVVTNLKGTAAFAKIVQGVYTFSITYTGYRQQITRGYRFPAKINADTIKLQPSTTALQEVSVAANKPFIQQKQGKIIVDVEASVTSAGSTVLEVLEKSPGITVDKNGGIAMQGKTGVLVMIDDKPTYLGGADLNNLLSSMNSAQVAQIELIANPSAKYDASGNAGVINIKTKKNKQKGFNGSFTTAIGQGVYPKNNNSLVLNYRSGKFNTFLTYSVSLAKYLTNLYALRKYYDANNSITSMLEQPAYFKGNFINNTVKTGFDYYLSPNTTVGIVLGGTLVHREGNNEATATWQSPGGVVDSAISTTNKNNSRFKNGSINLNVRHTLSPTQDIAADMDWLHYTIQNEQNFNNRLLAPGGYEELSRGNIPTTISIASGKVDYTHKLGNDGSFQSGFKSSYSSTDNAASYQNFDAGQWVDDNSKSNRFLYGENINALYSTFERKYGKVSLQAGLRYEHTGYHAHQLGNAIQKDSAFSRNYGGFFPSGYLSYQADSSNSFTFTAGRRIDRPAFQTLNPFYFIINKYTYSTGNPYILPQYSWNLELSHQYKNLLTTSILYSNIKNYFSQLFLKDAAKGILLYTQGNVGHTYNIGLSSTLVVSPFNWWSLTAQAVYNHKQLRGFNGNDYTSQINQLNISANNQFTIAKKYTAEISGFYTTRARNDVQELLYPTGQLSVGVSKPILKKKATLKFTARDIFYTNAMEGLTQFPGATEYFILRRDSRVFTLAFTYRFGKSYKTTKRTEGSAGDVAERVGNG
jgi:iron complex outermembrane receptor protein